MSLKMVSFSNQLFFSLNLGKKYRYFYAISADVDAENPGTVKTCLTFSNF